MLCHHTAQLSRALFHSKLSSDADWLGWTVRLLLHTDGWRGADEEMKTEFTLKIKESRRANAASNCTSLITVVLNVSWGGYFGMVFRSLHNKQATLFPSQSFQVQLKTRILPLSLPSFLSNPELNSY